MSEKQWLLVTVIGLTVFNVVVISWGLDQLFNGSDTARIFIVMSFVITVPVLIGTVLMSVFCFIGLIMPESLQKKILDFKPPHKIRKIWHVVDDVIDFFD